MVEGASQVQYVEVANEVEALLLETNLIKKYQPRYNILMTDDKSYIWVKIHSEMEFPIVKIVRSKKDDKADYFGPYPAVMPVKRLLKNVRKIFPYRTCNREIKEITINAETTAAQTSVYSSDMKPCLYYHLGLCAAPCMAKQPKAEYRAIINNLKRFLRSEHDELKTDLKQQMQQAAGLRNYEKAAEIRDQLKDIEYLTQYSRIDEQVDEVRLEEKILEQKYKGLDELTKRLQNFSLYFPRLEERKLNQANTTTAVVEKTGEAETQLDWANFKIECYDISNIQGSNAVAAMVVAVGGKAQTQLYRKFKIKSKSSPDDFAMLQETMQRRFKYLLADFADSLDPSFSIAPDLLVIDGGKGQLSSVLEILEPLWKQLGHRIPCIGLAKRQEEVVVKVASGFQIVKFSKRSNALHILQGVRDEAHRFGLGYHRKLRSKGMVYSELDLIPGVGDITKKRLIMAFGSVAGIRKAKLVDIESVVKNRNTALKLKKLLI